MNTGPTGLERIIEILRARDDVEGASALETAEGVQREINQIRTAAAAVAALDVDARLAHCQALAGHLHAIVDRFVAEGVMNPSALLRDNRNDRVFELARVHAIANALETLTQEPTASCGR